MSPTNAKPEAAPMKSDESAHAQIVAMHPRKVSVSLKFPATRTTDHQHSITLEWSSDEKTMPLSELLLRIEAYVSKYGEY
jgi:hypothetical protein